MKERPILFSAPMVWALLDGSKTQTRRPVKCSLSIVSAGTAADWGRHKAHPEMATPRTVLIGENGRPFSISCPYGQPGDRLWVRETFFAWGRWETRYSAKKARDEWHFVDMTLQCGKAYLYDADHPRPQPLAGKRDGGVTPNWWKRPAIFMPRVACRLVLEVRQVRVERLQGISEQDAIAEGLAPQRGDPGAWGLADGSHYHGSDPRISYWSLWEAINGAGSVAANPWVWVVEFKRAPQEGGA